MNNQRQLDSSNDAASSPHVKDILEPYIDSGSVAGVVALVADSYGVLSIDALGFSDVATKTPMSADSLFWIASQTKSFVSTSVMMLVEEGLLRLDDAVEQYLPEFKDQWVTTEQTDDRLVLTKPVRPITIEDLLTHTSGLPFRSAIERPTLDFLRPEVSVGSYAMTPLLSQPGTYYQYSNAGINTAARLVEIISGLDFSSFIQFRLLAPLGMSDTTFWPNAEQVGRLAKAYKPGENGKLVETNISQLQYPLENRDRVAMPAGGLFSTASDVAKFCRMYLNKGELAGVRYLSEDSIGELTRPRRFEGTDAGVGLCWYIEDQSYQHGGALSTNMTIFPETDRVLVYLVQHEGFIGDGADSRSAFLKSGL